MAKPAPANEPLLEMMKVLMPTSSPCALTSAPPELPGLMAASVWMKPPGLRASSE
jgi:hypothetical protein